MSSPIILAMTNGGSSADDSDFVARLAAATNHLDLNINPDMSWEEAMSNVRSIGKISEQIYHEEGVLLTLMSPHYSRVPRATSMSVDITAETINDVITADMVVALPIIVKTPTWFGGIA